ncbi:MAG: hypothetical protein HKP14_06215 [Bacteroidia bacterium]|nr:hypothetical protein [Bacteroidia bacterium]
MLFCLTSVQAQTYNNYLAGGLTPGFLLAHRSDIKNLAAHNYGIELSYEEEADHTSWGKFYSKPTVGFGLLYYNLGQKQTGHGLGGLVTLKFNLFQIGRTDVKFRMGAGLALLSERFDVYQNRRNQAIGSNLNGSMQFAMLFHHSFNESNHYLNYGIGISHYSNAAFRVPNLGYNIPAAFLRYGIGLKGRPVENEGELREASKWNIEAAMIYAKKQRNFANPVDFYNLGIQLRGLNNVNPIKAWRVGIDAMLDKTYKYANDPTYPLDSIGFIDKLELGVAGGFQWKVDKVDIFGELGAYVYKPAKLKNALYQRMGVRYNLGDRIKLSGALKFHRGVADYFEMGLGYRI